MTIHQRVVMNGLSMLSGRSQARIACIVLIPGEISRQPGIPFPIVLGYPCPTLDPDGHRTTRVGRNDRTVNGDPRLSANENKALATRFIEEAFTQGRLAVIDALVAPDYVTHAAGFPHPDVAGPEAMKLFAATDRSAFPDYACTIEAQIAEGDTLRHRRGALPHSR